MSNKELNVRHALVIGLALNRNCADTINEIYYKNEKLYHDAYLNSGLHNDLLKKIFTMKTEDMINKLSGIVEVCYKKNDYLLIEKIIRKVHPSIVNFVKKSNVVDLDKFNLTYNLTNLTEDENFSCGIALLYLTNLYGKQLSGNSYLYFILNKWQSYISILTDGLIEYSPTNKKDEEFINEQIAKGYDLFMSNKDDNIDCSLELFISEDIEKRVFDKLGIDYNKNITELLDVTIDEYEEVRNNEFNVGINRYIGSFSRYIHSLGLDSADIFVDTKITNKILENMFIDFSYSIKGNNVSEDSRELYIASCIFIYNLVSLYKECKDIYLNKVSEDKYKELKSMEESLTKEKEKFNAKVFETKLTIKENKKEIEELKKKLKELERENKKLSSNAIKDKDTIKSLKQDLNSSKGIITELQDHLRNIENIALTKEEINLDDKIEYINEYKIGIFGGMTSIKTLSNKLENIVYYNSQNQDISSINTLDMVFVNSDFINHAFTNKIKSVSSKLDVPMKYISGTNDDLIIETIYTELNRLK